MNPNQEYQRIEADLKEIVKDAISEKEAKDFEDKTQKEAGAEHSISKLMEVCAISELESRKNAIFQTNQFIEYDMLRHKELEYIKSKKSKIFEKDLKRIKAEIIKYFKIVKEHDKRRIVYHREIEKRLGFEFEVGLGGYMAVNLAIKILEMEKCLK